MPGTPENQGTSTRPYLLRALHDWCTDNGFTPYIAVHVDAAVQVPMEYVKNHEIVLNVGFEATSGLKLGNEFVEFHARFGGVSREITVPVDHVVAIYARENGQGMAFPMPTEGSRADQPAQPAQGAPAPRGLRLASSEPEAESHVPASVEPAKPRAGKPARPDEGTPPPDPTHPGGGRPSLKRIK
jgi:stringent starvation protein B